LETRWLGQGLDHYAAELFEKLQGGGVLMGFIGNLLASAYRPMRFGIINKLIAMLYQILIEVLTTIHNTIWRIFFVPLLIIAVVLILLPLVDVTIIAQAAWRLSDSIAGVFGSMSSYFTQ